jgi:hypothetical protein
MLIDNDFSPWSQFKKNTPHQIRSIYKKNSNPHQNLPMFLLNLIASPDIMPTFYHLLAPCHWRILQMTCKRLRDCIDKQVQEKIIRLATEKYAHAVLLPNGAFRLTSRLDLQSVDIRAIPGMNSLMFEANHLNPMGNNPIVSMKFNGETFIGRPWGGRGCSFMDTNLTNEMFRSDSTVLLAGNVWISKLDHDVDFFNNNTLHTVLSLMLDRGYVVVDCGMYPLEIVFTRVGW